MKFMEILKWVRNCYVLKKDCSHKINFMCVPICIYIYIYIYIYIRVKVAVCGLRGRYPAGVSVPLKPDKCHLFLPSPMHACPRHCPWKRLRTAKSCKARREFPTR